MAYAFMLYLEDHKLFKVCCSIDTPQHYVTKYFENFYVEYMWSLEFKTTKASSAAKKQYIQLVKESDADMFSSDSFVGEPPDYMLIDVELANNPPTSRVPVAPRVPIPLEVISMTEAELIKKPVKCEEINDCPF